MLVDVRWHGYLCTFLRSVELLFRMYRSKYKDSFIKMQMKKQTLGQGSSHKHQYYHAANDYLKSQEHSFKKSHYLIRGSN